MEEGSRQRTRIPRVRRRRTLLPAACIATRVGTGRFGSTCGAGHIHKLRVGRVKTEAMRERDERRIRAQREPGRCPAIETRREWERVQAEQVREKARVTSRDYAQGLR